MTNAGELAQAVAARDEAWHIDAENQRAAKPVNLAMAESLGDAYAVTLREGVGALDLDQGWTPEAQTAYDAYALLGFGLVRCTSGGKDGVAEHLFVAAAPGWDDQDLKKIAIDAGVPALVCRFEANRQMRPPLSPHRFGGFGQLIEPASTAGALAALSVGAQRALPLWVMLAISSEQDVPASYRKNGVSVNRSDLLIGLAAAYVNAGQSESDYNFALRTSGWAGLKAKHLSEKPGRTWARAREWVRKNPRAHRSVVFADLRWALDHPDLWGGRTGTSDNRAFRALVAKAEELGRRDVSYSVRSLAEVTGLSRATAGRALGRLGDSGFLRTFPAESAAHAATQHLNYFTPDLDDNETLVSSWGTVSYVSGTSPSGHVIPDVFRGRGLPHAAAETFASLSRTWQTTTQITAARPVSLSQAAVRSHLHRLQAVGLAERNHPNGQKWRLPATVDLDRAAARVNTLGHASKQEAAHAAEREQYSEALEDPYHPVRLRRIASRR